MSPRGLGGAEHRPRVERTTVISDAIQSLGRTEAMAVLAVVLYRAPLQVIANELGVTPEKARQLVSRGTSRLRHPMRAAPLRYYGQDDEVVVDSELRALIREWKLEERFAPRCEQCGQCYQPPARGWWRNRVGRPRRFCSGACRQKAYRKRCNERASEGHA